MRPSKSSVNVLFRDENSAVGVGRRRTNGDVAKPIRPVQPQKPAFCIFVISARLSPPPACQIPRQERSHSPQTRAKIRRVRRFLDFQSRRGWDGAAGGASPRSASSRRAATRGSFGLSKLMRKTPILIDLGVSPANLPRLNGPCRWRAPSSSGSRDDGPGRRSKRATRKRPRRAQQPLRSKTDRSRHSPGNG